MASLSFENAIALNYQNLFWDRIYPSILLLSVKCYPITLQQLNRSFFSDMSQILPSIGSSLLRGPFLNVSNVIHTLCRRKTYFSGFGRRLPSTMSDLTPQHLSQWPVDYASTGMLYYSVHLPFQQTDTVQYPFTTCFRILFCNIKLTHVFLSSLNHTTKENSQKQQNTF